MSILLTMRKRYAQDKRNKRGFLGRTKRVTWKSPSRHVA